MTPEAAEAMVRKVLEAMYQDCILANVGWKRFWIDSTTAVSIDATFEIADIVAAVLRAEASATDAREE